MRTCTRIANGVRLLGECQDAASASKLLVNLGARAAWRLVIVRRPWLHRIVPPSLGPKVQIRMRRGTFFGRLASYDFVPYYTVFVAREYAQLPAFLGAPGWTVVDVGAHVGMYTVWQGRKLDGRGKVYAFEPNSDAFGLLRENVSVNGLRTIVDAIPHAVSQRDGQSVLILDGLLSTNSHMAGCRSRKFGEPKRITVSSVCLDTFVRQQKVEKIDCLKIDVEGGEVDVLRGGLEEALPRTRRIVMEYHARDLREESLSVCLARGFRLQGEFRRVLYFER